jgi:hypothetical protein
MNDVTNSVPGGPSARREIQTGLQTEFRIDPAELAEQDADDKVATKRAFQIARRVLREGSNYADFLVALREAGLEVIDW